MKPVKTLIFTLFVFVLLAGAMWLTPDDGVKVAGFTFHMPTISEMISTEKVKYADISEIIDHQVNIDSLTELEINTMSADDSISEEIARASYDSLVQSIHRIEMNKEAAENLSKFFTKLHTDSLVRIMHYGDSQLEGDRITAFLRNRLQTKFGGSGPGLRPALQPYDYVFTAIQVNSDNWKRYPAYGKIDSLVEHDRYGVMGAFSRFAPPASDSLPFIESDFHTAFLSISKSDIAFRKTQQYKKFRMFYGNEKRPVSIQLFAGNSMVLEDTLQQDLDYGVLSCVLPDSTDRISLRFEGWDSPDIYGIELADTTGIIVDNIALRGSSGVFFTKTDFIHSKKMYDDLHPALLILQFGGNVMPYIMDENAVENYGRWFGQQIQRLKQLCPNAAILVIGPSDMSTKVKDKYVTYEFLPAVVDALKNAALSNGSGYWDMYQAMGGYNSMPGWVNADPELARPDYVHFSSKGARLIANMFYNALMLEYNNYLVENE